MYLPPVIEWLLIELLWLALQIILIVILALSFHKFVTINREFRIFGIPQPWEPPFLGYGGMNFFISLFQKRHINDFVLGIYRLANGARYIAFHIFSSPVVVICDPDLVRDVLVTHFNHFTDHYQICIDNPLYPSWYPVLAHNPIFANRKKWRDNSGHSGVMHNRLRSMFTSRNIRSMFDPMSQCAENFVERLRNLHTERAIDMKDVFSRYASDAIFTLFGIEVNSLREPGNEFYAAGKRFTDKTRGWWILKCMMKRFSDIVSDMIFKLSMISMNDAIFYVQEILKAICVREESDHRRLDVLQLMDMFPVERPRTIHSALMYFLSGLETISVQMCLVAHELATHPEVQQELQNEIARTLRRYNGKLTYSIVSNMKYLDAVIKETLRLHPGTGMVTRMCTENYILPSAKQDATRLLIKAGVGIIIPIAAIHRDPNIYEDPDTFRPERFLAAGHRTTNLSFGLGQRSCLGTEFAVMEMKMMFVNLLTECTLEPCAKTCIPLIYDPGTFSPAAEGGFWLRIRDR